MPTVAAQEYVYIPTVAVFALSPYSMCPSSLPITIYIYMPTVAAQEYIYMPTVAVFALSPYSMCPSSLPVTI